MLHSGRVHISQQRQIEYCHTAPAKLVHCRSNAAPHRLHRLMATDRSNPQTTQTVEATAEDNTYAQSGMLKKAGQNFNSAGISLFLQMWWGNRSLAIPHLDVPDIRAVDWGKLRAAGFKGCVFDKDNTLTEPYVGTVAPHLAESLQRCRDAFDNKLVVFSNSAGLAQFDPEGKEAEEVEKSLGVHVLRHTEKKPAGGAADMEKYFGCAAHELVMVGDRYFTDVVFGNRHGMLTIRPAPLTSVGEPTVVRLVRRYEFSAVTAWRAQGNAPPEHKLLRTAEAIEQCRIKEQ